jgi:hypothetical protein
MMYGLIFIASHSLVVPIHLIEEIKIPLIGESIISNYELISRSASEAMAGQFVVLRLAALPLTVLVLILGGRHLRGPANRLRGRLQRSFLIFSFVMCTLMSFVMLRIVVWSADALNILGSRTFDARGSIVGLVEYWFIYAMFLPWMILATGVAGLSVLMSYRQDGATDG